MYNYNKIKDNFKGDLSKWNRPNDSNWNTKSAVLATGKMLVVTNSSQPGLLKGAFSWYNYEFSFKAMIPSRKSEKNRDITLNNIGIFIRAKDSLNGIMLQIGERNFVPHYLFDGYYIIDNNQIAKI